MTFDLSGIDNKKYSTEFLQWIFNSIEENSIKNIVQIGLDDGYLSSLFLSRVKYNDLNYLGIGQRNDIPEQITKEENFFFVDGINNVETVAKVANFVISNGLCIVICEEMQYGPLFYFPLLKPGDVMVTHGKANLPGQNDVTDEWKYYIK